MRLDTRALSTLRVWRQHLRWNSAVFYEELVQQTKRDRQSQSRDASADAVQTISP